MKDYATNMSIRISITKLDKLDTEAEKLNITRTELINNIINEYLRGK